MQDIATYQNTQETLALLKMLALGNQEIAQGNGTPIANVACQPRSKKITAKQHRPNELQSMVHAGCRALRAGARDGMSISMMPATRFEPISAIFTMVARSVPAASIPA
ncbi:MAG: hypothetical protein WCB93_07730 [Gallionella sp.]